MGLLQSIFGGSSKKETSSSQSNSYNQSYPDISAAFAPVLGNTYRGSSAVGNLLGLFGGGGQNAAFDNFRANTGYDFQKQQGMQAVQQGMAGAGAFDSGATRKNLMKFGTGLADSSFNSYLQALMGYGDQGLKAGQVLGATGDVSNSQSQGQASGSENTGGLGKAIGSALSLIAFSDMRLKENLDYLGEHEGLAVYEFNYLGQDERHIGVLAQEVEGVYPEALGPVIDGYMTVDYSKIPNWEK